MEIIILTSDEGRYLHLKHSLGRQGFTTKKFEIWKLYEQDRKIIEETKAVIIDREEAEIRLVNSVMPEAQVFVILQNWSHLAWYESQQAQTVCRFYIWPVNWQVLSDDIRALSRINEYTDFGWISADKLYIDMNAHTLTDGEKSVFLRNKEYELILHLARNRGKILSRQNILEEVWDFNSQIRTNTVDVHISRLRKLIRENFGIEKMIVTVPCAGYMMS